MARTPAGAAVPHRYLTETQRVRLRDLQENGDRTRLREALAKHRAKRVTLQELGDVLGVSRERVRQIVLGR